MAIVEMKRASLLGLQTDEKAILRALQKLGCFQVTPAEEDAQSFHKPSARGGLPAVEEKISRVQWAIGRLGKYDTTKAPLLGGKPSVTEEEIQGVLDRQAELFETVEALEALEREAGDLRGQQTRVLASCELLAPWQGFALPISQVRATRNTVAMLGTVQKSALENWLPDAPSLCSVETVSLQRDLACVYVVMHRSVQGEVMGALKEMSFAPVALNAEGTVAEELEACQRQLQEIDAQSEEIKQKTAGHVRDIGDLKILADCLNSQRQRLLAAEGFVSSERTFYLRGWVPAAMTERVEKALRKVSPSVSMEFETPEEGDEPPVLLRNNAVVTPFESVVAGFSLPAPGGIDPTAVMMPFFVNFMGMMISDAGYGVLMVLLIPIMLKYMNPSPGARNLMKMLAWGGFATVIWGALFNTWFGFGPWPTVFDPVNNSLPVMAVCVGVGALHLFAGLGVAAYVNIRDGKPWSAVADQLSWFLLVVGLALLVVLPSVGQWVALTGAAIILCTSGREKSKNPLRRLLSGLGALYGMTSWVSDLLSYMRLFGMGLATGVIGMVFNQLVGMVFDAGIIGMVLGVVLFVFCHLFNAGINILGAYVHSCRLQYIEFFGKFYEDGGKPFVPLRDTNRYVYIKEAGQRS